MFWKLIMMIRIAYLFSIELVMSIIKVGLPISICYELKKSLQSEWEFNFENNYTYFPTKSNH